MKESLSAKVVLMISMRVKGYAHTLRAYQKSQDGIKSDARDKARAIREQIGD